MKQCHFFTVDVAPDAERGDDMGAWLAPERALPEMAEEASVWAVRSVLSD